MEEQEHVEEPGVVEEALTPEAETGEEVEETETLPPEVEKEEEKVPVSALKSERAKRQYLEKEAEYWRQQAEKFQQKEPEKPVVQEEQPPKVDDFDDYDAYLRAAARYEVRQEIKQENARKESERKEQEATQYQQKQQQQIVDVITKARATYQDFDSIITPELPVSDIMLNALAETDHGSDILYHFAKHPEDAERISKLSPFGQVREIGKIEAKLTTKQTKITSAPEPIKPVSTSGNLGEKDPAKMSDAEYTKWRQQRKKNRR